MELSQYLKIVHSELLSLHISLSVSITLWGLEQSSQIRKQLSMIVLFLIAFANNISFSV